MKMGIHKGIHSRNYSLAMRSKKIACLTGTVLAASLILSACGSSAGTASGDGDTVSSGSSAENGTEDSSGAAKAAANTAETNLSQVDMSKWLYNEDDDVWYQLNIQYAENSPDENYDTLAIFVPGNYFDGTDNGDGTYTCTVNTENTGSSYTAQSAPIVVPVNTPGYAAQAELTDYTDVSDYTGAGFVYVHIGCRGRDAGAPYGVTDLKAGIRYIRYNDGVIAGDMNRIFSFGMSGGGAQSALLGATGDSSLYDPYLTEVGAVEGVSDAVDGSMCWCPITSLDTADAAYEWNLGVTRTDLSEEEQAISDALASSYADYINSVGLTDEDGNVLTLEDSGEGIYQAGTYYDYIQDVIESSLENFISDTEWPYDASSSSSEAGGMGGIRGGGMPSGEMPDGDAMTGMAARELPDGAYFGGTDGDAFTQPGGRGDAADADTDDSANGSSGDSSAADAMNASEQNDDITRNQTASGLDLSGTYETAQDYIDALNADGEWVTYDASTGEVSITSVSDFVSALKNASKNLGAFDQLDDGQGENTLFGYGDGNGAHFDSALASILEELGNEYAQDYAEDLERTDSVGNKVAVRLEMYSPLNYLVEGQPDYGQSTVAKYWRIRTGINQSDTALSTEVNLALALMADESVESVDFATVWGLGHTMAERTGDSTTNFINWVNECAAGGDS